MSVKVEVTVEDISNASHGPDISFQCPIAKALKRSGFAEAEVGSDFVRLFRTPGDPVFEKYDLPDVAQEFIRLWDIGLNVAPFEFELN